MESASSTAEPSKPVLQRINDPVPLAEGHPNEYVVQVGDTLWDIAATFLKDPWYWPEIWYVNPDIENPHLIYPGDILGLVTIDGSTRITNVRTSTYRLSPQARVTPLTESINSIPFEAISSFLSVGAVLEKDEIERLPYIVASRGEHLMTAAVTQSMFVVPITLPRAHASTLFTLATNFETRMTTNYWAAMVSWLAKARCELPVTPEHLR
jgi:hypothetical protein